MDRKTPMTIYGLPKTSGWSPMCGIGLTRMPKSRPVSGGCAVMKVAIKLRPNQPNTNVVLVVRRCVVSFSNLKFIYLFVTSTPGVVLWTPVPKKGLA
jgi:hypothetical protein